MQVETTRVEIAQKEILTSQETMQLLDISRTTFDRLRKDGVIKSYKLGKRIYCKYSELIESLQEQAA